MKMMENKQNKKLQFKKCNGEIIEDVITYVDEWLNTYPYSEIIVGCDSQEHSRYIKYSTIICLHEIDKYGVGHGCHLLLSNYFDTDKNMKTDIYTKLWEEAEFCISTAKMLQSVSEKHDKAITIHLDYNGNEKHYSYVLSHSGIGYCQSEGFKAKCKPFSIVSSNTCDMFAKK